MSQLVIVGRRRADGVTDMIAHPAAAALQDTSCSVHLRDPQNAL
jgi:hypothetical protein